MTALAQALAVLRRGDLLLYPTEAVYGLGGDARRPETIAQVLAAKAGRDPDKGLLVVVSDWAQVADWVHGLSRQDYTQLDAQSRARATTFVLPATAAVPQLLRHKAGGIAVRRSRHPLVSALCRGLGAALISTSANPPGGQAATSAEEAARYFPQLFVLAGALGGESRPSRIIDWRTGAVLRP